MLLLKQREGENCKCVSLETAYSSKIEPYLEDFCLRLVHRAVQSFKVIMNLLEGGFLIGALGSEGFLWVVVVEDGGHRVTHSCFIAPEGQHTDILNIHIFFNHSSPSGMHKKGVKWIRCQWHCCHDNMRVWKLTISTMSKLQEKMASHLLLAVKLAAREMPASLFFNPVGESILQVLWELLGTGNTLGWSSWKQDGPHDF